MDLDQLPLVRCIQLHRFIPSQRGDLVKIHLFAMPEVHFGKKLDLLQNTDIIFKKKKKKEKEKKKVLIILT